MSSNGAKGRYFPSKDDVVVRTTSSTGLFKAILISFVISLIALIAVSIAWAVTSGGLRSTANSADSICELPECALAAASLVESIQYDADPCADFYTFVCGNFPRKHHLPDGSPTFESLDSMTEQLSRDLRNLFEKESKPNDSISSKAVRTTFNSCMNETAINLLDLKPINDTLRKFGGWPLIDPNWKPTNFHWESLALISMQEGGSAGLISMGLKIHVKNNTKRIINIHEPTPVLERDLLLGKNNSKFQLYQQYLIDTAVLLGADPRIIQREVGDLLQLDRDIANISMPSELMRGNVENLWNPTTLGELKRRFPKIDWNTLMRIFPKSLNITDDELINVHDPNRIDSIMALIDKYNPRTIAAFIVRPHIMSAIGFLPDKYQQIRKQYQNRMTGSSGEPPRWQKCVGMIAGTLWRHAGAMYVAEYFDERAKAEMESLVDELRSTLKDLISESTWMDSKTKSAALDKLSKMRNRIGFTARLLNETYLTELLHGVVLRPETFVENMQSIEHAEIQTELEKLRKPYNPQEEDFPPALVNAFYSAQNNEIMFPAGILQFPMYNMRTPMYFNYCKVLHKNPREIIGQWLQ